MARDDVELGLLRYLNAQGMDGSHPDTFKCTNSPDLFEGIKTYRDTKVPVAVAELRQAIADAANAGLINLYVGPNPAQSVYARMPPGGFLPNQVVRPDGWMMLTRNGSSLVAEHEPPARRMGFKS